jgi:HD-like signal output (HDOD) protein/ActR/RegA family two-component response regulator
MTLATVRPRILFVDDEQRVLDGLSASLWKCRKIWDMKFVCGGPAAVETLRAHRFDAVVTDMRMPEIDGESVLVTTATHHPGTVRLILSGQTDRAVVTRTTSVAHQFLSKPCPPEELRECLDHMLAVARPMPDPMRDLVCAVGKLPVSPRTFADLDRLLGGAELKLDELVRCAEADIGLTAKLLHVAGAGFYAKRQRVMTVSDAIDILGVDAVRGFVRTIRGHAQTPETDWLFDHALSCGRLMTRLIDDKHAFLAGVLHGVGKLAMLHHYGPGYAELLAARTTTRCLHDLEQARFGLTHDAVGAQLVELWGLSPVVATAIRSHCAPHPESTELAHALHVACALTDGMIELDRALAERYRAHCGDRMPSIA